jgi:hypothetical protein
MQDNIAGFFNTKFVRSYIIGHIWVISYLIVDSFIKRNGDDINKKINQQDLNSSSAFNKP